MGAPRQTRNSHWSNKKTIDKYHAFRDEIRLHTRHINDGTAYRIIFMVQMANSWSDKKKAAKLYQLHDQKPDTDNMVKAVLDAMMIEDCKVAYTESVKLWSNEPLIIIEKLHQNAVIDTVKSWYSVESGNDAASKKD
jgi:Holliday junction resolvase RusA-like endonuclease